MPTYNYSVMPLFNLEVCLDPVMAAKGFNTANQPVAELY